MEVWRDKARSMIIGNCCDCRYSTIDPDSPPDVVGECRRYAPKYATELGASTRVWPIVEYEDWCGEFVEDDKGNAT